MTVTPPAAIQITDASALYLPGMSSLPLQTALENLNYLIQFHRPQLASVAYTDANALTRSSVYVIPVMPSVDSLRYTMQHRIVCSNASQSITVTVDECTTYAGAATTWNNIYSQSITSNGTGGLLTTHEKTDQTIPSTATALRVTYTAPAAGDRNSHHLLVWPTPGAATTGITPSGAIPFDDGLIAHADRAAVHTEWLNRCKASAVAVLQDRRQGCLSFVQDESNQLWDWTTPVDQFQPLPPGRIWLANQGPTVTIDLRVLAKTVVAGVGTSRVRVRQTNISNGATLFFAADNTIQSGSLVLQMQGKGLMSYADVEVAVRRVGSDTSAHLMACMGWHKPGA